MNVVATTLGAGALSLPYAFSQAGIYASLVTMIIIWYFSVSSIRLLVEAIDHTGKETYEEISVYAYGRTFGIFIEANMIFFCFGTAVGYAISIGTLIDCVTKNVLGVRPALLPTTNVHQQVEPRVAFVKHGHDESRSNSNPTINLMEPLMQPSLGFLGADEGRIPAIAVDLPTATNFIEEATHSDSMLPYMLNKNVLLCLIGIFVLMPLSAQDSLQELRYISFLGVSCIVILILAVKYSFFEKYYVI